MTTPEKELTGDWNFPTKVHFGVGRISLLPEFKTDYLRQLIADRRNIIGAARTEQALQSLGEDTDPT